MTKYIELFKQAVLGTEKDFTSGSLNRALFLLSIPMILEMVLESLFALVDIYFVGKISTTAVATVALTESVTLIIFAVAIGLSMAVTANVARRVGEKKPEEASSSAGQGVVLTAIIALAFGAIGFMFPSEILRMMGGSEELAREGALYTRILLGGNISVMLIFINNAIFRGAGDASIAMKSLWLSNGLNIVLDPLLIFGLDLGLKGAAIATVTGRSIGVIYQFYHLFNGKAIVKLRWELMKLQWAKMWGMLKLSVGGILQFLVGTVSWIVMVRISARFGEEVIAGYAIAFRIIMFTILPSWGLSNAVATIVGQSLGAQKPDRAEKSVWKASLINSIFLIVLAVVLFFGAELFVSQFEKNPAVIENGVIALQYISFGYIFFGLGMVVPQAFNGAGDTYTPTLVNLISHVLIEIPLAYVLAVTMGMGPKGIFTSIAISAVVLSSLSVILFKRGKWKLRQV